MHIEFELVTYNEDLDTFDLNETMYQIELSEEEAQSYELFKSSDLNLYNWLKESSFFIDYLREEIYPHTHDKKIAISDINGTTFRRFFFFKVSSADTHYEYFKKLFNVYEESDWQDREEVGEEILEQLRVKRKELLIDLKMSEKINDDSQKY